MWRLGHADSDGDGGMGGGGGGKGVRVWLPSVRLNSTHDLAAGMSVAPESAVGDEEGGGGEREDEVEDGRGVTEFDAGEFGCKVCYIVTSSGVVTVECDVTMPEHWPVIPRWVVGWGKCG